MSKKLGGVAVRYVDGFFVKSDEVAAEGAKLQPKEVFRGALGYLFVVICVLSADLLHAQDGRWEYLHFGSEDVHAYLSVGVLRQGDKCLYKSISNIKRVYSATTLQEKASIRSVAAKADEISKRSRTSSFDGQNVLVSSIDIDSVAIFGMPMLLPVDRIEIGSHWKKRTSLAYGNRDVPIVLSYTMGQVKNLLGREMAVIDIILTGFDPDSVSGSNNRVVGIGKTLWDVKKGVQILNVLEIRYGDSREDGLRLEYSESLLF